MRLDPTTTLILERLLELAIGIITIISIHMRFNSNNGISIKDLLKKVERQDREIERLRIEKRQHNYRTIQAKHKHLHLSNKRYTL